jgi:UPF0042 nucleotide-binding protein
MAARYLEDLGFFCVDNLPVTLIPPFYDLILRSGDQIPRAAVVVDVREGRLLDHLPEILGGLRERRAPVSLLFFEANDDILKRRFSETRRPHPMAQQGVGLEEAIRTEREVMAPLREISDRIIDTTRFTVHDLRKFLKAAFAQHRGIEGLNVNVVSFGFKYGVPAEADLVFDVRFLPNPYFVDGLRALDGTSEPVRTFLWQKPETEGFLGRVRDLLDFLVPLYAEEGKSYLTVTLGCTGGKHRSVALAEAIRDHLVAKMIPATVSHRDLGKE